MRCHRRCRKIMQIQIVNSGPNCPQLSTAVVTVDTALALALP